MAKLVHRTLAETRLTPARKRKLVRLAARPNSEIDFSEIPPLKESFWKTSPVKLRFTHKADRAVSDEITV